METDKESRKELADGNLQLAKGSSDHLPDKSTTLKENGEPDDGADEKLVADDNEFKTNKDASEVKFISVDSQNGDAKIDIENLKIAFAGMGKEELMKFANDPFWVRLRWFLFISFWLLWVAMLAGAITIIVMAPKCSAPAPLKWWEQSPLYQVFVPTFKDREDTPDGIGDLGGLQSKLDYIEDLGVKGLALSSILKVSSDGSDEAVEDFKGIDPRYGTIEEFNSLITSLKSKGLHLVLSLVPNHSSKKHPWFVKSERNDAQYKDYYIWSSGPPKYDSEGRTPKPPNNWMSVHGGSAWEWSEVRKSFYLHQFHVDEPDLNFTNPAVIEEFREIFKFWLDLGVSGFQLEKVEYLLEDPSGQDEGLSRLPGVTHDERDFYSHKRTMNQPGIVDILAEWKKVILNNTDGTKMLSVLGSLPLDSLVDQNGNTSDNPVDLLQTNRGFYQLKNDFTASDLNQTVQKYLNRLPADTRPTWQLSTSVSSRVASRLSYDYVDGLNMIVMLLPGTPITLYGEEFGMEDAASGTEHAARCVMSWSDAINAGFSDAVTDFNTSKNYETVNVKVQTETAGSSLSLYKELVEARNTPSIMYGTREFAVIGNNTVFAFTRIKSGNPGYLVAFNTADEEVTVSFNTLTYVPEELNVLMKSSNFNSTGIKAKSKLNRDAVVLSARSALVTTFVPKLE